MGEITWPVRAPKWRKPARCSRQLWPAAARNRARSHACAAQAKEQIAGFARVASGVASMFGEAVASTNAAENIEALADEIASWMGLQQPKQAAALPAPPARES